MSCYLIWISIFKNWGKLTSNKPLLANIHVLVKSVISVGYKVIHIFISGYSVKWWRKKNWLEWKRKILFWVFYVGLLYYYQMIICANKYFILFSLNDCLFSILAGVCFCFFAWQLQKEFHAFHLQHSFPPFTNKFYLGDWKTTWVGVFLAFDPFEECLWYPNFNHIQNLTAQPHLVLKKSPFAGFVMLVVMVPLPPTHTASFHPDIFL